MGRCTIDIRYDGCMRILIHSLGRESRGRGWQDCPEAAAYTCHDGFIKCIRQGNPSSDCRICVCHRCDRLPREVAESNWREWMMNVLTYESYPMFYLYCTESSILALWDQLLRKCWCTPNCALNIPSMESGHPFRFSFHDYQLCSFQFRQAIPSAPETYFQRAPSTATQSCLTSRSRVCCPGTSAFGRTLLRSHMSRSSSGLWGQSPGILWTSRNIFAIPWLESPTDSRRGMFPNLF